MNNLPSSIDSETHRETYRSYLLRIWYTGRPGVSDRRATLEDLKTGERIGFATLEQLFVFLMEQQDANFIRNPVDFKGEK